MHNSFILQQYVVTLQSSTCFEQHPVHPQEDKLFYCSGLQSALNRHTVRLFTESDDTRDCSNKICPPEDEQDAALNMLRIVM